MSGENLSEKQESFLRPCKIARNAVQNDGWETGEKIDRLFYI